MIVTSRGIVTTFRENIPNKEDPLRARSTPAGTPGGVLLINSPYKPIPNINMTVPARYTSAEEKILTTCTFYGK